MSEWRANQWVNEWISWHIHRACRGEMAFAGTFSPTRTWTSSRGLFPDLHTCTSKHTLTVAHWMTCHDFNVKAKGINVSSPSHPRCRYFLVKAPSLLITTHWKISDTSLPPTALDPPHLVWYPGLLVIFSKYLLFCPFLSMPLSRSCLWHSHRTGALLCAELCSWDPTPNGFHPCP